MLDQNPAGPATRGTRFAIVGAGLSGLYAAWLLQRSGVRDYVVLEARDGIGGRIASFAPSQSSTTNGASDRFDLGPAWFWPGYQPELDALVTALGLPRFTQFETGDMLVERTPEAPPMRTPGYANAPPSMRLVGGMAALTDALHSTLNPARVITGQAVRRMRCNDSQVELDSVDAAGAVTTWQAEHVLLALPPRLAEERIEFIPALPPELARQWRDTPTWMAAHAKYLAVYEHPFWREHGLSGEARSAIGPLVEIHDASLPGGRAALFGFFGVPAHARSRVPEDVLLTHCRAQLTRLFGPQAGSPRAEVIKDWAKEPHTATTADQEAATQHAAPPATTAASGPWRGRVTGIASEWSPQFPGYVAGAVEAARLGVQAVAPPAAPEPSDSPDASGSL